MLQKFSAPVGYLQFLSILALMLLARFLELAPLLVLQAALLSPEAPLLSLLLFPPPSPLSQGHLELQNRPQIP